MGFPGSLPQSGSKIKWLTANSVKFIADRDHDKVIITLPCGEERDMERNEFKNLVRRMKMAEEWLSVNEPNTRVF